MENKNIINSMNLNAVDNLSLTQFEDRVEYGIAMHDFDSDLCDCIAAVCDNVCDAICSPVCDNVCDGFL